MAIFRGVGSVGDIADNSLLEEITAQAEAAEASATAAEASATAAANSATSALNTELTSASFNTSDGVLTLTKQDNETVTTDLDGRFLPLSGGTLTGSLTTTNLLIPSGSLLSFDNNALVMFSASGESVIREGGDGDLSLEADNLYLRSSPTANYLSGTAGAEVKLYHNGSEKLTTTSTGISVTGISVTGDIDFGSSKAIFGANDDLQIYNFLGASIIKEAGSGNLEIRATDLVLKDDGGGKYAQFTEDGDAKLFYDNSEKLATTSGGISVTGTITATGYNDSNWNTAYGWGDHSTAGYLTSFDITEQTDPKYLRSNADDTTTGTITAVGLNTSGQIVSQRTDNVAGLVLKSSDTDANSGPVAVFQRNNAEAGATGDALGHIRFMGQDSNSDSQRYAAVTAQIEDPTDASHYGGLDIAVAYDSVMKNRISLKHEGSQSKVIINESGDDVDFRVESDTNQNALFLRGSDGNVGIATGSPSSQLTIQGTGGDTSGFAVKNSTETVKGYFNSDNADADFSLTYVGTSSAEVKLKHNGNVILCESAGNVGINKSGANTALDVNGTVTATDYAGDGSALTGVLSDLIDDTTPQLGGTLDANDKEIQNVQNIGIGFSGDVNYNIQVEDSKAATNIEMMRIKNTGSYNGRVMTFYRGSNLHGNIGTSTILYGQGVYVSSGNGGLKFQNQFTTTVVEPCGVDGADYDNAVDLGRSSNRFDDIYATNSTIQTSDRNLKQDIESLTDAEQRVAVAAKGLLRKFRWRDAVEEKGDDARIHFGIIAQDLQDAFTAEGLDSSKYAMFCSNTWWEHEGENYYEADHAPEGATEVTRLGVRYSELLAFIISAI
jgi:hypothetical protein